MELRAFVLHLVRADKRRPNAQSLLKACGVVGEIWPAVDGSAMSSTDLEAYVGSHVFEPAYPFSLKTGEIGCFLSHRQIWAEMQNREVDAALIIEDDAGLDPQVFNDALELAWRHIETLGYIQFQTRPSVGPSNLIDTNGTCALIVPQVAGLRTTAQMVSRDAAAQLLSHSEAMDRPVDTFVQSHWHTGLRPAMIHPSGISDIAGSLDGSTIQGGQERIWTKLQREVARARYRSAVKHQSRNSSAPISGGSDD